jgi:hypothetical protein
MEAAFETLCRATINLHELNTSMSGATATGANRLFVEAVIWKFRAGAPFPNVLAIGRIQTIFPMRRKRRLGESIQDLSGRSGHRVRHDRCNHRQSRPAQRWARKKGIRTKRSAARAED